MVGLLETPGAAPPPPGLGFLVSHQKVHLDIEFATRQLRGTTEITISPHTPDLKTIRLNCRQCHLNRLTVNGKPSASLVYTDPYTQAKLRWKADVHQYHMLQERLEAQTKIPPEYDLVVNLPKSIRIQELDPFRAVDSTSRQAGDTNTIDLGTNTKISVEQVTRFTPITISIDFTIDRIREGLQFIGWDQDDLRYPHVYSQKLPTSPSCCLFPCLDAIDSRSTWEVSIKCPKTIGDALRASQGTATDSNNAFKRPELQDELARELCSFSQEDQALDLAVICSGDMTDEIVDPKDSTKKTTSFVCTSPVAPQHIGFAIGPFEHVNLAAFRESDEDDKLGQNAIPVHGFCLPGRIQEMKNTCLPLAKAIDFFTLTYGSFPFSSYKICFLDDMIQNCIDTASLSLCSNHLLFPEEITEPLDRVTRQLVHALACQWLGVNIIPKDPVDTWAVVGMAYFVTDMFMRKLSGNNEYRYQQKKAADRVVELDIARPSIYDIGQYLWIDPSQLEFIAAKAPLVLFILDRRLTKASGSSGLSRIISRVFLNAKVGDLANGALTTAYFIKTCEKLGHAKLDVFFNQWVFNAGCPRFRVTQRFNKKRLVVEMLIQQVQGDIPIDQDLKRNDFMRDVKEEHQEIDAGSVQSVFTGPMTIRIHEADGTPYEHIVEIKEATTKFDIPYNTKYKRLKRSRRQKERTTTGGVADFSTENQDDVLLYCLGDVLQSEQEVREWKLTEWSKEDEDRMSQESYEWIRMDADFEWICKMSLSMPGYMYLSQLQQDRDVVAQFESVQYMALQREHPLVSTILIRTLMDGRYFHGIRTTAAAALAKQAKDEIGWLGQFHLEKAFQEFFCFSDSRMTRSNDFSNRASYYIQCAIIKAMSKIRDNNGKSPLSARKFLFEKLRYNDNSNNEYSDCHYLATLMDALAETIATSPPPTDDTFDADFAATSEEQHLFTTSLEEIDRYRRIDEWIPSYHNILSITALKNQSLLAEAGCIPLNPAHYLQYTQPGTFDILRVIAFSCLMDLGQHKTPQILSWFLYALGYDPSPYIRSNLLRLFGRTLGAIAIGEIHAPTPASLIAHQQNGLIIEQDSTTSARQADLARKQTIPGALAALKTELSGNMPLKKALWSAIESPLLTLHELHELLEICSLLYTPETRMLLTLRYPRYWRCINNGRVSVPGQPPRHIVTFKQTERIRTKPIPKIKLPVPVKEQPPGLKKQANSGPVAPPVRTLLKPPKPPPGHKNASGQIQTPTGAATGQVLATPGTQVQGEVKPKLTIKLNLKKGGAGGSSGTQ